MANTAAHLVDRVLPAVAVRQWVLSLPFELRKLAAFDARALAAFARIFAEALAARYRAWAKRERLGAAESGAVTFVQRFGSSINLHVHFHVVVLDGVFTRDARAVARFHEAPAPTRADLDGVVRRVHRRAVAWLARHGHVDAADGASNDSPAPAPLDACAAIAMRRGNVRDIAEAADAEGSDPSAHDMPVVAHDAVDFEGFNLHASIRVDADDDLGRERLCRYGARPPLALDRLRALPGGRVAYRIKKRRDGRAKSRVMTAIEFLARLAALIPPPRYPLVRYHGVLAPRSSWRRDVVPKPPREIACTRRGSVADAAANAPADNGASGIANANASGTGAPAFDHIPRTKHATAGVTGRDQATHRNAPPPRPSSAAAAGSRHAPPQVTTAPTFAEAEALTPNIVSVRHWGRLLDGLLYATAPRVDWATLLQRSFEVDVLECAKCHGRIRVLGTVTDADFVRAILEHLDMPAEAPRAARARDPTDLDEDQGELAELVD